MLWLRRLLRSVSLGIVFVVVPLAVALAIVGLDHLRGSSDDRGSFVVGCGWSHTLPDDPIVHPRRPGASHLHDFYGNVTTNASSTRASMLAGPTTCRDAEDRAAVWSPTAYLNAERIVPIRERTYYFGAGRRNVRTVPADLKMLAGNGMATSAAENPHVTWDCSGDSPRADHPYDCSPYRDVSADGLVARIDFPECWDGLRTDSATHVSHVAYRQGRRCPPTHPQRIPRIRVRVHYGIWDPCAGARPCSPEATPAGELAFRLSSGPYYTVHADFWNTWRQGALNDLVAKCVNASVACGGPMP
jgi:Domain of unknown function (DUF1996)